MLRIGEVGGFLGGWGLRVKTAFGAGAHICGKVLTKKKKKLHKVLLEVL